MPTTLAELCIRAGTSRYGCCGECGAQWTRVIEKQKVTRKRPNEYVKRKGEKGTGNSCANTVAGTITKTTGWAQGCTCSNAELARPVVLDPFAGAGTTLVVAKDLDCDSIGIELSKEYVEITSRRIAENA
jgi:hypothetical protein